MKTASPHIVRLALLALLPLLAGCSSDSSETPLSAMFFAETPDIFTNSVPVAGCGPSEISEGGSFRFVYDNSKRTVDIQLLDVDLGSGSDSYTFKGVPWEFSVGTPTKQRVVSSDAIIAVGATGNSRILTDVSMIYYEANELDPANCRGIYIDFTADGRRFTVYPRRLYCKGTTVAVEPGAEHAILYAPALVVEFHPLEGKADLAIDNFSLDDDNSGVTVAIPSAQASFSPGGYSLSAPAVTVSDTVRIENFRADASMSGRLIVEYRAVTPTRSLDVRSELRPNTFDTPTAQSEP